MSLQSICFDLDDTLYSYEAYARAGLRSAAAYLERETGEDYYEQLLTLYFEADRHQGTFDALVERHDLREDIVSELVTAFHSATTPLPPYPETEPLLTALGEQYSLGLITDGREGRAKLQRLGIESYFDEILVTPTINRSKHDPVVFEQVLEALGLPPSAALYVGDDPRVDFAVPNDLGMGTVRLRRGRYKRLDPETVSDRPDDEIDSLADIHAVLGRAHGESDCQAAE